MKRQFRFLVATATSVSLMIANVPLAQFTVRADEEDAPTYTFTSNFVDEDEMLQFISGETVLTEGSEDVFPAGTINVIPNEDGEAYYKYLRIITMENDEEVVLYDSTDGSGSYSTDSDFRIMNFSSAGEASNCVGILDIIFINNGQDDDDDDDDEDYEEDYRPHFSIALDEYDEPRLGYWDGEDIPFFVPLELGDNIPSDSVIHNDLPEDLPDECELIYFINGEEVESSFMNEREETFTPGHFVILEDIIVTEFTFEIYFQECWIVAVDVMDIDVSMTVLDEDGNAMEPIGYPESYDPMILECADDDYTYFELCYTECPAEITVESINGYAILFLWANEEDVLTTPIGENKFDYPDDDYVWVGAWGKSYEPDNVICFVDDEFTFEFDGLSEKELSNYIIVVDYSDIESMEDPRLATYKAMVEEEGYTDVLIGGGYDITLYDKNGIVHNPGFEVTVTIELVNIDAEVELEDGQEILFLHLLEDGGYELLKATFDSATNTITFKTSSFSPFIPALGTKADPAPVVKSGEGINTTRLVIASLFIGAAAVTGILFIRRRKSEIEKEQN